jgi:hypothetical protein
MTVRIVLVDRDATSSLGSAAASASSSRPIRITRRACASAFELRCDEKTFRLRVPDDRGDLARGEARAHGHDDRAELQHRRSR